MKDKEKNIRKSVSKAYTEALKKDGCGSAKGCCCQPSPKGVVTKTAGYSSEDRSFLPSDAVINSFGCGNPLAFSDVREGEVVLDLGCGAGIDIILAGKKVGPQGTVIGVDMTDAMVERANANIAKAGLKNVEVRKGIIEKLPVDDNSIDWIISNCVINLSADKERVFSEMYRVLKPGGRVSVSDIVVEDLPEKVKKIEAFYNSCITGALRENEYVEGLERAGFKGVRISDRLTYEGAQLKGFIGSEIQDDSKGLSCEDLEEITASLEGKVSSVRINALKEG